MGILLDERSGRTLTLAPRGLVGRSSICSVRIDDARVSGEHARLTFRDERWEVRDLGSRNGTFVHGELLARGGSAVLTAGETLAFGAEDLRFRLLDASPPVAQARRVRTGEITLATPLGMLALPHDGEPSALVFEGADGTWIAEIAGETRVVADGDRVDVGGEAFILHLPLSIAPTAEARAASMDLGEIDLCFRVSPDEERVEVTVVAGPRRRVLPPRAHYYTFLLLARARLRDTSDPRRPDASRGWIPVDEMCRMLSIDEMKLNVEIYRIRQDLAALGVANAASVIERRRGIRQVRLGLSRVSIEAQEG